VTVDLVSALIDEQFPEWSGRPVRFAAEGRDNTVYRVGDDPAVRLPRRQRAADRVPERFRAGLLLPPDLPLAVSRAVALGAPGGGYQWRWTVDRWVDGTPAVEFPSWTGLRWIRPRDWAERFGRMCTEEFPPSSVIAEMGRRTLAELADDA
jgi:aminoglycoside phosphotransferase (APT) family kinase protein